MANTLGIDQIYTVVNSIVGQATGKTDIQATDASSFVTVADIALQADPDVLLGAISQVLSKTIISTRPYERKFKGLEKDSIRFGNHVRKLSIVDKDFEKDQRWDLVDGQFQTVLRWAVIPGPALRRRLLRLLDGVKRLHCYRTAMDVAGERKFRDFRKDNKLDP